MNCLGLIFLQQGHPIKPKASGFYATLPNSPSDTTRLYTMLPNLPSHKTKARDVLFVDRFSKGVRTFVLSFSNLMYVVVFIDRFFKGS
jgi:hypothetical protein